MFVNNHVSKAIDWFELEIQKESLIKYKKNNISKESFFALLPDKKLTRKAFILHELKYSASFYDNTESAQKIIKRDFLIRSFKLELQDHLEVTSEKVTEVWFKAINKMKEDCDKQRREQTLNLYDFIRPLQDFFRNHWQKMVAAGVVLSLLVIILLVAVILKIEII